MLFSMMFAGAAVAAGACQTVVGRLATVEGQVEVQRTGSPNWQAGVLGGDLCQGDTVRAGANSRATVALINQAVLRVDQNTAMRLDNISGVTEERSVLSLLKGAFQSFSRKPRGFEVNTPYLNGSIEGTEFVFRVEDGQSELTVLEGLVVASNSQGNVSVSGGESAVGEQGKAPYMRTVVRPRDAVQWSLYYPPVLATQAQGGDPVAASLQNAATLLSVGRVDEAQTSIADALQQNPNDGMAYALRAVINVVQNNTDQALADGNQAVALSPDSSAAKIALSYAQQAAFDIQAAHDTLQQAVQQQPDDALALARLAELQLMLGDRKQARESAQQASALDPNLARTQLTLGFAALAEFKNEEAKTAFERAIDLSSSDPMAHLGLGLAKISNGNVEAGGRDIEVAVALDSNSALLRSYLGKTYFAEKRNPLDGEQFAIAKQLDPNDPTAYLYDGILKQTVNRPVEAARDFDRSIELNDDRAVYRSRLLLDKDRASRGTSQARAYRDLGFSQLGLNASTDSLGIDPSNASAHRYLSDVYQGVRRREVARVSELFQAQMLQDVNTNPIQPSVSSTNLNIVTAGGPASAGFNEFTPLFERNKTQFDATAMGGNNSTTSAEAVVTTLHDNFSLSAGGYYFDTDGFRKNNDINHEIYNVYGQVALTPAVNVQAEYRYRDSSNGDLAMNFDPDDFDKSFDRDFRENTARLGVRFTPNQSSNVLLSYIYSDRENDTFGNVDEQVIPNVPSFPDPPAPPIPSFHDVTINSSSESATDETANQYEGQYLFQGDGFNITTGATYADVDQKFTKTENFTFDPAGIIGPDEGVIHNTQEDKPTVEDKRAYVYGSFNLPSQVTWTLGMSYHDYDQGDIDYDRYNPKVGLQWDMTDSMRLRAAYFKVVKPALASNRTLEPTQVAGFNQYFDDTNATRSERWGGAFDWSVSRDVFVGAEYTRRELETPEFLFTSETNRDVDFLNWDEWSHRVYAYWTPADRWSLSAEAVYDKFEGDDDTKNINLPEKVRTLSYPVRLQYFHPSGFFAGAGVTYVDQKVDREKGASFDDGDSDFTVGDIAVGYRFPRRMGIASLSVQNVTDEDFDYQDDSFREFQDEPSVGPYIPDRAIMGRFTLNF
jgi:tetratricopeptide (TPR) repeat protein